MQQYLIANQQEKKQLKLIITMTPNSNLMSSQTQNCDNSESTKIVERKVKIGNLRGTINIKILK